MSRRRPVSLPCAVEGCRERAYYEVATVAEDRELRAKPWYCSRHRKPDEVLSLVYQDERQEREQVLEVYEESYGRFWGIEGTGEGSNGIVSGPGFKAFASDFPAGTKLVVSARLVKPRACPDDDPRCNYPECSCWEMP